MSGLIFLSHIHEEAVIAHVIQEAIENEFSGFVEVFVSSDGKTIPAGANFLRRIEDGLTTCIGAIYLISPISVKRNWINFELGAVWIRNTISIKSNGPEIPTIPFCHSGSKTGQLPMPLTNLNAIQANNPSQLEFAFKSIQKAVGGKGKLKTDFDALAQSIMSFEREYTLGEALVKMFTIIDTGNTQLNQIITRCKALGKGKSLTLEIDFIENKIIEELKSLEISELKGYLKIEQKTTKMSAGMIGGEIEAKILADLLIDLEGLLIQKIK